MYEGLEVCIVREGGEDIHIVIILYELKKIVSCFVWPFNILSY